VIKIALNFCGILFRTLNPFLTWKPTVTEVDFEINRIELYIVLMGKRTFLLLFM